MRGAESPGRAGHAEKGTRGTRGVTVGLSRRYRAFKKVVVTLSVAVLGLTVYGEGRVPERGALIVASNHRRYLDPFYVSMAVPRRIQWMGKKELFVFPFERLFYLLGCFPVDRQGGGRAGIRSALSYLELGAALGIFPEGTRRKDGYDAGSAPKSGAVMLAARSGAEVLPVHVGPLPSPLQRIRGRRFEIHIGEPRVLGPRPGGAYGEAAEGLVGEIYALPEERG